ncbi:AraC-like DNA-binding protein [Labrenzia sp. EL_208]|uniref:AraC family transcriptional regulator n=1 Tax=Roseibium album TaxID=311410 RepID=UPI0018C93590|nr:AraC family transcriptional regulator [Roseibium album]MBG6176128.1 AraC-like DNA-binding protein [Labrenzia sp. EL_132]MBG6230743.1 AraC-like DNA-binding protein [Labrenzia sp. EL_208]
MGENSTRGIRETKVCKNLEAIEADGLERLCGERTDAIRMAPAEEGVERIEARFRGNGFNPHRHDTYAIGLTLNGVQTFRYRGEARASLPGQIIVIHPDELHDGGAGTERGLRYRMIYIQPEDVQTALGHSGTMGLPFVDTPVLADPVFRRSLSEGLEDIDHEMGELKRSHLLAELSQCLSKFGGSDLGNRQAIDLPSLRNCAEFLRESHKEQVRVGDLEGMTNLDRFTLSRQFKTVFGTSPHRYLVMRRLETVKRLLVLGKTLVEAAVESGFSDQSHMTRHFKRAFGMTPGMWRQLTATNGLS